MGMFYLLGIWSLWNHTKFHSLEIFLNMLNCPILPYQNKCLTCISNSSPKKINAVLQNDANILAPFNQWRSSAEYFV